MVVLTELGQTDSVNDN